MCFDIFCAICGNPCNSSEWVYKLFLSCIEEYKQLSRKKKLDKNEIPRFNFIKGYYELTEKDPDFIKKFRNLNKITKWMNKCSILLIDNRVIHNVTEKNCNVVFYDNKNNQYEHIVNTIESPTEKTSNRGMFIHSDCLKYINNKYKIKLTFNDLPIIQNKIHLDKMVPYIDQGRIKKYQEQDFGFIDIIKNEEEFLCYSPLLKKKNIGQINKNVNKLKLKPHRKSPIVSATFYKNGDVKIGNNKMFWMKKQSKWVQINDNPIIITIETKKTNKSLNKIPYIGVYNTKPLFIMSLNIIRNKYIYKILTTKKYEDKILETQKN